MDMGGIISMASKKMTSKETKSGSMPVSIDNERYESGFSNN
jgi:hypothetical protein|nr:MAG TPA: hypothetical protein [Bacteriophage sp.]